MNNYKNLMKTRNKLLSKAKKQLESAKLFSRYGGRKSKYRNEASAAFYESFGELNIGKKRKGIMKAGEQLYTEEELKAQIKNLESFFTEKIEFEEAFKNKQVDILSDDTIISWNDDGFDDDENHVYMKDIQAQWDDAGVDMEDEYPTWIKVFTSMNLAASESVTVGDLKKQLQSNTVANEDKAMIRQLLNQVQRQGYYFKGRI